MIKKIVSILVGVLFSVFLLATPGWAINVLPGDRVELKATSVLGVPLHRVSLSSLVGRAPDGTIAEVLGTANNDRWVEIKLPDGDERWISDRYVRRIISQQDEQLPDSGNPIDYRIQAILSIAVKLRRL